MRELREAFHAKAPRRKGKARMLLRVAACLLLAAGVAAGQRFNELQIVPDGTATPAPGQFGLCESQNWLTAPNSALCHTFEAPADITTAAQWILPAADGTSGQALTTDGLGVLSWATVGGGGGCPAGSADQVQVTNGSICTASSNLTFNSAASVFVIGATHTGSAPAMELGTTADLRSAIIDIHTSSNPIDYDTRFIGSGGSGTIGQGTMTFQGDTWTWGSDVDVTFTTDGATNIGTTASRAGKGHSDNWNSERYEFSDPAHANHMSVQFTAGGLLEFQQTDNTPALRIDNTDNRVHLFGDLRPDVDGAQDVGVQDTWEVGGVFGKSIVADDAFVVQSTESAEFKTCNSTTLKWPSCVVTGEWSPSGGSLGESNSSAIELGDSTGDLGLFLYITSGGGGNISLQNTGTTETVSFDGDDAGDGKMEIRNDSGELVVELQTSSNDGQLLLYDNANLGTPSSNLQVGTLLLGRNAALTGQIALSHGSTSGSATLRTNAVGGVVHFEMNKGLILDSNSTTGSGEGAMLIEITKDSASTIEADNFSISGDGNLYGRAISGDATCTTVDDAWLALQTTSHELQSCSGGATRFFPSTTAALPPLTLNCAASEVVIDPRWENGILVEGTCGAN